MRKSKQLRFWGAIVGVLFLFSSLPSGYLFSQASNDLKDQVEEFALKRYIHGVPYIGAKELGVRALPILEEMLKDQSIEEFWPTIIMTIGFIGDDSMVDVLIDFLESRFEGEISVNKLRALLTVFDALGPIAENRSKPALDYLSEACYMKTWMDKELRWKFGDYSGENLAILLAKMGVNGLSISGTDQAKEILIDLDNNPENDKTAVALEPNIEEGLERINLIQNIGAENVYGYNE